MKKTILILIIFFLCFALIRCNNKKEVADTSFDGQVSSAFKELWSQLEPKEPFSLEKDFDHEKIHSSLEKLKQLSENESYNDEERKFALTSYNFMNYTYDLRKNEGHVAGSYTAVADNFSRAYYALANELYQSWISDKNIVSEGAYTFASQLFELEKDRDSVSKKQN